MRLRAKLPAAPLPLAVRLAAHTRRLLFRVAVVGLVALLGLAVFAFVTWRRLTALPDWFEDDVEIAALPADDDWISADPEVEGSDAADPSAQALLDGPPRGGGGKAHAPGGAPSKPSSATGPDASTRRASSGSRTMRNFHLRTAVKNESLRKATKASRAEFVDGELRAGVVFEPGLVDRDSLDPATRKTLDRAFRTFPGAKSRRVYVGLVDTPRTVDGLLQLGPDTRLRVGDVELDFDVAMRRLGLSPSRVRGQIDAELRRLKVRDPRLVSPTTDE